MGADVFRPTIGNLIDALETDPKQFPKKKGKLKGCRAAEIIYADGIVWRAVFTVDEADRSVFVIALDPHDRAYENAVKRLK